MKIDFKEVISIIDLQDFPEGKFNVDYKFPDGRSINLIGRVDVHGSMVRNYHDVDDPGYFDGIVEICLYDWIGYDSEGNEIPVVNSTWFENKMQNLLNE